MPSELRDLYHKEIIYSPDDHDYAAYLNGEYIGSFKTNHDAERELDNLIYEQLVRDTSKTPHQWYWEMIKEDTK